jgi:hypothetical protein
MLPAKEAERAGRTFAGHLRAPPSRSPILAQTGTGSQGVAEITLTIDGRAVPLSDWQCDSAVNWGYRSLTGKIPESVTWAEQEAPVVLWLPDGTELWAGKVTQDPWATDGMRDLRAEGYANDISASKTRMFYRHDGTEGWVNAEDDPHNYAAAEDSIDAEVRRASLWVRMRKGQDVTSGNVRAFAFWTEGGIITRYAFTQKANMAGPDNEWRGHTATGPAGSGTLIAAHNLTNGTASIAQNVTTGQDLLTLQFRRAGGTFTAGATFYGRIVNPRIYGRTIDDGFSASGVVADVAADAGLGISGIQSSSLAVLPLDWTEDNTALLTYMAELTDWHWEAGNGTVSFGPWETTWTGYQAHGIKADWQPQKRFNKVVVPFSYISGASGEGEATASPDPFPGSEVTFYADELEFPQQNKTLANAVAANLVAYYASARAAGRLTLGRVTDSHGEPSDGFRVRPGHVINVADRTDLGPQRIVAMTYRENEVTADINDDFNAIRLLHDLRGDRPAARRKRKRRRKKR